MQFTTLIETQLLFLVDASWNEDPQWINIKTIKEYRVLSPKWDICITAYLCKGHVLLQKSEKKGCVRQK